MMRSSAGYTTSHSREWASVSPEESRSFRQTWRSWAKMDPPLGPKKVTWFMTIQSLCGFYRFSTHRGYKPCSTSSLSGSSSAPWGAEKSHRKSSIFFLMVKKHILTTACKQGFLTMWWTIFSYMFHGDFLNPRHHAILRAACYGSSRTFRHGGMAAKVWAEVTLPVASEGNPLYFVEPWFPGKMFPYTNPLLHQVKSIESMVREY